MRGYSLLGALLATAVGGAVLWTVVKVSDGDTVWATWTAAPADARHRSSLATNCLDCATVADFRGEQSSAISQPELPPASPRIKIRLDKIDAPESDQKWGKESKEALSGMVLGREVELVGEGKDRYGRRLSVIWCEGREVNLELVKLGLAWHYAYHDKTEAYREAEAEARREKRGLWQDPEPVNPYEWRKRKKK